MIKRTPSILESFPLLHGRGSGHVVLQYPDACNAGCPQRFTLATERSVRTKTGCDTTKRIIDTAAQRGVKVLSVTGGEPYLYLDEIIELLKYAKAVGINITSTGTNGHLFANPYRPGYLSRMTDAVERLAESGIYAFWINFDSADPVVNEQMSGLPDLLDGIEIALPIFHNHGIYPSANLWINKNIGGLLQAPSSSPPQFLAFYRTAFQEFYRLAIDLGFTIANVCYPMHRRESNGRGPDVCGAVAGDKIANYTSSEKQLVLKALYSAIPEFRHRIRILSPRSFLHSLMRQHNDGEHGGYHLIGGYDHFLVDVREGRMSSCCYPGYEDLGTVRGPCAAQMDEGQGCRKYYRECYRDPSEMIRLVMSLFTSPDLFYSEILHDGEFSKLWIEDLKYFRDCEFFDCSKPPDFRKLDFLYQQAGPSA